MYIFLVSAQLVCDPINGLFFKLAAMMLEIHNEEGFSLTHCDHTIHCTEKTFHSSLKQRLPKHCIPVLQEKAGFFFSIYDENKLQP